MNKRQFSADGSAEIMGNYSHGIALDMGDVTLIFVTGQIAQDTDGKPVATDDIEKQTRYVFESIDKILRVDGASLDDVVKAVIYVKNIADFRKISPIRNEYFAKSKPVSTLVEISATVKEGCDIEIEVIAAKQKEKS